MKRVTSAAILDEVGENEGMLPLLQYALKESWALRKGNTITAEFLRASGGVREPSNSRRNELSMHFLPPINRWPQLPTAGDPW